MKVTRYTTFGANGKAYEDVKEVEVTLEADEPRYLESDLINIYPQFEYQVIEGFGGSMTGTAAYHFSRMDEETRKQAMKEWFVDFNLKFVRMSLDSCDYSLTEYQAVEDPLADPNLDTFSIKVDKEVIIPMLKEAMAIAKNDISVLISPWSPPKQWKTNPIKPSFPGMANNPFIANFDYDHPNRNRGGSLKPEYYGSWAKYVVKFIQAYLEEGIPVTMLTIQNEPRSATPWDSCVWTSEQEKVYLRDYLYPEMKKAGLTEKVGIFIWDHNKERTLERALEVLDEETVTMIEGIAFHGYTGDHFEQIQKVRELFPDKTLMLSEICGLHLPGRAGRPGMGFVKKTPEAVEYDDAVMYAHDIIGNINSGMNRWIDWNFIVDGEGGPRHLPGGFTACMIANEDGTYRKDLCYSYLGHFARFILPGAKRILFSRCDDLVDVTAVKNPDGKLVLVVLNRGDEDTGYVLRLNGELARTHFPAHTISTVIIEE